MHRQSFYQRNSLPYPYQQDQYDGEGLYADNYGEPLHLGSWQDYSSRVRRAAMQIYGPTYKVAANKINTVAKKLNLPPYHTDKQSRKQYGNPYINAQSMIKSNKREEANKLFGDLNLGPYQMPIFPQVPLPNIPMPNVSMPSSFGVANRIRGRFGDSSRKVELMNMLYELKKQPPCTFTQNSLRSMSDEQLKDLWDKYHGVQG
jgi:hypothetical protein